MNRILRRSMAPVLAGVLIIGTGMYVRAQVVPSESQVSGQRKGLGHEVEHESDIAGGIHTWSKEAGRMANYDMTVIRTKQFKGKPDVVVDMDLKRAEFIPNEIRVKKGQLVLFRLHIKDNGLGDYEAFKNHPLGVDTFSGHGFYIDHYDVWLTGLHGGDTRDVMVKADLAGNFQIQCVVICSKDHYLMHGQFIVEG